MKESVRVRSRSDQSLRFESAIPAGLAAGTIGDLSAVDFDRVGDLAPWIALLQPDREEFTLNFLRAGERISGLIGREASGLNYLDFVDPEIKGDAFDSAFLMLERPIGLWQITPCVTADGDLVELEYTGFPVFDRVGQRGLIILLTCVPAGSRLRVAMVKRSRQWAWLDLPAFPRG